MYALQLQTDLDLPQSALSTWTHKTERCPKTCHWRLWPQSLRTRCCLPYSQRIFTVGDNTERIESRLFEQAYSDDRPHNNHESIINQSTLPHKLYASTWSHFTSVLQSSKRGSRRNLLMSVLRSSNTPIWIPQASRCLTQLSETQKMRERSKLHLL